MSLRGAACVLSYLLLVEAMFMDLGEQEERCIIEDIPEGTLVTGESMGERGRERERERASAYIVVFNWLE